MPVFFLKAVCEALGQKLYEYVIGEGRYYFPVFVFLIPFGM